MGMRLFGNHGGNIAIKLADDIPGTSFKAGQTIQLVNTPSDFTMQEEIDTYLSGYSPFGFRADEVCRPVLVDKDTGKFRNFGLNNVFRRVETLTSKQGAIREVDVETSLNDYTVQEHALGSFVSTVTELNTTDSLLQPRKAAGRRISQALALMREIRVWGMLTTSANWAAGNVTTLTAGLEWNGGASSDPVRDIQARMVASAQLVTDIWMSLEDAFLFVTHARVRDYVRAMRGDNVSNEQLARAFTGTPVDFQIPGLPPIHVVPGKVLNETTGLLEPILGDSIVLTTAPPGIPTDGEEIATCYAFRRRGTSGTGWESREFFVDARGLTGGTMLVAGYAEDIKMVGNNVGGLIQNVRQ